MGWLSLLALALALAMDAFAVAIVTGLSVSPLTGRHVFRLSFHFGLFQALMPVLGWSVGAAIYRYISHYDHWIAFGLLVFIGTRMTAQASRGRETGHPLSDPTSGWDLVMLAVATSIDALAAGLSLAMLDVPILVPSLVIGAVAAAMTLLGMVIGRRVGAHWGRRVEVLGGLVLIGIGINILISHFSHSAPVVP